MPGPTTSPRDVHALVVGIETYAFGPRWTLPGPSDDAMRFREWLLERGVPDTNIRLHLAPAPGHAPDLHYRPCDRTALRRTLVHDLPNTSSRLLWVYWGGHGYLDDHDHLRLLTADATEHDAVNVDLDDALAYYNSTAVPHHPEQVWIVDACATFEREMNLTVTPPAEALPHAERADRSRQIHFHAARRGRRATNLPSDRTGRFSSIVMKHLRLRTDADTPLDPAFIDAVERDTRADQASGEPASTRLREPGRDITFGSLSEGARRETGISTNALDALITDLCSRPWASDSDSRQNLVDALPRQLGEQVPRSRRPRADLVGIILHLDKVAGGLRALHQAVQIVEGASYHSSTDTVSGE